MRHRLLALMLAAPLDALAGPANAAVTIDWVPIGDPGNPADTATNCLPYGIGSPDCGSVSHDYRISKYEVTNVQYAEFLNAVAAADTYGLYSTSMSSVALGGITQSGFSGSYSYAVKSGQGNNPVVHVSWHDALRFANWLHNGQPTGAQGPGTTETGAYTFTGATTVGGRNVGALTFLPTENEWYKAAYYDGASESFFDYPTGSNTTPVFGPPPGGANSANFKDPGAVLFEGVNYLTDVGAYTSADSPYGTFDQGGNVFEWNETAAGGVNRGLRGGSWFDDNYGYLDAQYTGYNVSTVERHNDGFRVASPAPEPGGLLLVLTGGLVLAAVRRGRA